MHGATLTARSSLADTAPLPTVPLLLWSSERDTAPPRDVTSIPPILWTYWDDDRLPLVVRACLTSWRNHHPTIRIAVLHGDTLAEGMPPPPPGFAVWPPQAKSDWVRLTVLALFGGVWMDASTLLHAPLHFLDVLQARHRPDLIGYFNRERTHDAVFPMLENWFLAAPAHSPFMCQWQATFEAMLQADGSTDIAAISTDVPVSALLQGFSHTADYFGCHAAAQYVLRDAIGVRIGTAYRLALMPAECDAFLETHARGWDPDRVGAWLCDATTDSNAPMPQPTQARLTKLIGLLWQPLEARLQRGDVHPASIIGQLLR